MAKNRERRLPSDGELDRATDPQYAAISTMAVIAVLLGLAGIVALLARPLIAVPILALVLGLAALRKIRRSDGVLAGARLAIASIVLGAAFALAAGGTAAMDWWSARHADEELHARAFAVIDAMLAGDYGKIWADTPADYRPRWPSGAKGIRDEFAPLFDGAGQLVSRTLKSLLMIPGGRDRPIARAEVYVEFERRYLNFEVWFRPAPDGKWQFVGLGGSETLESQMRFADAKHPNEVIGPYKQVYDDEHHH